MLAARPEILDLLTELLIEVFTNLDYFALHNSVKPTCRRFASIINTASSSGPLSINLFLKRCSVETAIKAKHGRFLFTLHPLLRKIVKQPCNTPSIFFISEDYGMVSSITRKFISLDSKELSELMQINPFGVGIPIMSEDDILDIPLYVPYVIATADTQDRLYNITFKDLAFAMAHNLHVDISDRHDLHKKYFRDNGDEKGRVRVLEWCIDLMYSKEVRGMIHSKLFGRDSSEWCLIGLGGGFGGSTYGSSWVTSMIVFGN